MAKKLKSYHVAIDFYFDAEDENDAYAIADGIADYVETAKEYGRDALTPHGTDIECKVNEPELTRN